ncbi:MAG: sulfite exporter TauE/SafE family protein [Actinomycetota bacterium]
MVSEARRRSLALLFGLTAGVASGLLGVGGGIVMVPLLTLVGFTQHRAHATSLAAIVPIAAVGAATFAFAGEVDYAVAAALAAGSLVGAPIGARVMARAGEGPLKVMFGVLMLAVAVRLLWP